MKKFLIFLICFFVMTQVNAQESITPNQLPERLHEEDKVISYILEALDEYIVEQTWNDPDQMQTHADNLAAILDKYGYKNLYYLTITEMEQKPSGLEYLEIILVIRFKADKEYSIVHFWELFEIPIVNKEEGEDA